jgi:hypothetical protein
VAKICAPDDGNWDGLTVTQQETWRHFPMLGLRKNDMHPAISSYSQTFPIPGRSHYTELHQENTSSNRCGSMSIQ